MKRTFDNRIRAMALMKYSKIGKFAVLFLTLIAMSFSMVAVPGVEASNLEAGQNKWGHRDAKQPKRKCGDNRITGFSKDLEYSSSGGGAIVHVKGDYRYKKLRNNRGQYTYKMEAKVRVIGGPNDTNGRFVWTDYGNYKCGMPLRCRNFEESWAQTFGVRRSGQGPAQYNTENFSNARIWVRACYNGSTIYIEGHEETFSLSSAAQNKGFRPLVAHHITDLTPSSGNASNSSVRVRFRPHIALPRQPLSSIGVSFVAGFSAGFQDNGAQVKFFDYAINIDPHGCYIYTGGGSQKKCPHGRYGGN